MNKFLKVKVFNTTCPKQSKALMNKVSKMKVFKRNFLI